MENISKRHHYVPQFLIKRFANEDGMVYVLNKKDMRISQKSPKAVFFEWNRNTLEVGGVPNDVMEKFYSKLDTRYAKVIDELLKERVLTPEIVQDVHFLVTGLRWRIPKNDEAFESLKNSLDFGNLPFKIVLKGTTEEVNKQALDYLYSSDTFKESLRHILPIISVYDGKQISKDKLVNNYLNSYLHNNDNQIFLLGDVPVVETNPQSLELLGSFTFPLDPRNIFLCSDSGEHKVTSPLFYLNQNLATLHLADTYVACSDKNHLERMIQGYETTKLSGMDGGLVDNLFKFI